MKRIITVCIVTLIGTFSIFAQQRTHAIYAEFLGASNMFGISYDTRIKPDSKLGYRIGLSYINSGSSSILAGSSNLRGVAVPLELNYLLGNQRHMLELGVGTNIGYYKEKYLLYNFISNNIYEYMHRTFGYYLYSDIGYRYQSNGGFQFRVGFNPSFNFGDKCGVNKTFLYPYLSFGYAF